MRMTVALAVLLAVLPIPAFAQQPAASETVEVRLIEIDAIVTDRKGNPVPGLTPADFEILENGRPQDISNFAEYRGGEEVIAAPVDAAAPPVAQPQRRTIVILIDAIPLRGSERRRLFADVQAVVDRTMRDGDRGQVLSWHDRTGMQALTDMTSSRAEMIAAVANAEATLHADPLDATANEIRWLRQMAATPDPQEDKPFDGEAHAESLIRQNVATQLAVMRRKTAAIQRVLAATADQSTRGVLIYVSGSFPIIAGKEFIVGANTRVSGAEEEDYTTRPMLDAIVRTANSLGVIFYALRPQITSPGSSIREMPDMLNMDFGDTSREEMSDPTTRSFPSQRQFLPMADVIRDQTLLQNDVQALSVVANETGGAVAVGPRAIRDAAERIARDLESYYTLAYRAAADGSDRERRIDVRPKDRKYVVRTRRTILDRSDATRARDLMIARLFEGGSVGDIEFDVKTGTARQEEAKVLVPIELTIPVEQLKFEQEEDQLAARFSILAVAGENIGQLTRVTEASRRLALAPDAQPKGIVRFDFELVATPQPTNVSIAVFDEKSGLAGIRSILVERGEVVLEAAATDTEADKGFRDALLRASEEQKPIVAYFRPQRCSLCARFEREALTHPAIQRRLDSVIFVTLPANAGRLGRMWNSGNPGFGVFDRLGTFRLRFDGVAETGEFGAILDDIIDVAPQMERTAAARERGEAEDGELDAAVALARLGRGADARASVERALSGGTPETRQYARIVRALLDANDAKPAAALEDLDRIVAEALTPQVAGEAWLMSALIHSRLGTMDQAVQALANARDLIEGEPRVAAASDPALSLLERASLAGSGAIRIIPPDAQVVTGRMTLRTTVDSAEVAAVSFEVDGEHVQRVTRPPFSAAIDFGPVPEQRRVRVFAFDDLGNRVGRDELVVNEGGERFWFRLVDPREGTFTGPTRVKMALRAPATETVQRVVVSWNDAVQAVVTRPPWEAVVDIPAGLGILRGVAQLSDGRTAEDAVLLNAIGQVERADVQLVELPVTVSGSDISRLTPNEIHVREGRMRRSIESVQGGDETPLTVGLVIDTSGSMLRSLPDVQEAAIGFLNTVLGERDRAFIVTFDTRAKLIQPPTSDRKVLRQKIMGIRARGLTALHDAIAVGLLQLEGVKGRRALVVFSDGMDRTSRYRVSDVRDLARRSHVPIHLIAATPQAAEIDLRPQAASRGATWPAMYQMLSDLAESTGGSAHKLQRLDDLPQVYTRIENALRSQYLVFVRTDPGENANDWRSIRVAVASRGVSVHAPEGYYAPW